MAGDGTIIQKSRGVWEIQLSAGRDPLTGKYRRVTRTVRGTKADARRVRDELRREIEDGLRVDSGNITFQQWTDEYLTIRRAKGRASAAVLAQYETRLSFMSSLLGDVRLAELDPRSVEALMTRIREARAAEGIPCSDSTLRHYHALLKRCLKAAVDFDVLRKNPCDRVEPPKKNAPTRRSLSAEEASKLLRRINEDERSLIDELLEKERRQSERGNSRDRSSLLGLRDISLVLMTRLALASGLRLGEGLALTWGDIDLERSQIHITKAMDNDNQLKPPKSQAGIRDVYIDPDTMAHLAAWKPIQGALLDSLGLVVGDESPTFCDSEGGFTRKSSFRHWWNDWRVGAGFPDLRFHELRHTQATQLLGLGLDLKTVQHRLGHATAALTLDTYAHAVPGNDERAALMIGNLFSQGSQGEVALPPKTA